MSGFDGVGEQRPSATGECGGSCRQRSCAPSCLLARRRVQSACVLIGFARDRAVVAGRCRGCAAAGGGTGLRHQSLGYWAQGVWGRRFAPGVAR
jgi:hypothetical protein